MQTQVKKNPKLNISLHVNTEDWLCDAAETEIRESYVWSNFIRSCSVTFNFDLFLTCSLSPALENGPLSSLLNTCSPSLTHYSQLDDSGVDNPRLHYSFLYWTSAYLHITPALLPPRRGRLLFFLCYPFRFSLKLPTLQISVLGPVTMCSASFAKHGTVSEEAA